MIWEPPDQHLYISSHGQSEAERQDQDTCRVGPVPSVFLYIVYYLVLTLWERKGQEVPIVFVAGHSNNAFSFPFNYTYCARLV